MLVLILVKVFYHGNVPPSSAESRPGAGRFISALDKAEDGFPAIHDPQEAEFKVNPPYLAAVGRTTLF